jgi:hypothetical protein
LTSGNGSHVAQKTMRFIHGCSIGHKKLWACVDLKRLWIMSNRHASYED